MKRILAVFLLAFLMVSSCGCRIITDRTSSGEPATLPEPAEPAPDTSAGSEPVRPAESEEQTATEPASEQASEPEEEPEQNEPSSQEPETDPATVVVQSVEYELTRNDDYDRFSLASRQFSEGVAWASFYSKDTNKGFLGLINEAGEVLYILDQSRFPADGLTIGSIITTPFLNGLSCVYAHDTGNAAYSFPGFLIVNQKGEEVYSCFDENLYVLGQAGDGSYLLQKHVSGFSGDDWFFCTLDTSLKLTETEIKGSEKGYDRAQSQKLATLADGVFFINDHFLCLESGAWFKPTQQKTNFSYIGSSDSYACFFHAGNYYLIPVGLLKTATSESELCDLMENNPECVRFDASDANVFNSYGFSGWRHGTSYGPEVRRYCNFDSGESITYPAFPEGTYYFGIDRFRGGYAALYLIGADENGYVTVIDEAGNVLYDPVLCKGFSYYNGGDSLDAASYNGIIFCSWYGNDSWHMQIIDRAGQEKRVGDDLSELAGSFSYWNHSFAISIGEKYIWISGASFDFRAEYVSLDGSTRIRTVTAGYNSAGDLVHS